MNFLISLPVRNFISRLPRGRGRLAKILAGKTRREIVQLPGLQAGVKMQLDLGESFQRLMAFGAYQPDLFQTLGKHVRKQDRVLMAGANIGYVPLALANMGCRVVCFEADPRNVEVCRQNLALNPQFDIRLVGAGLSDQAGTLSFWQSDTDSQSSFAVAHHATKQVQVAVRAGDEALRELDIQMLDGIVLDVEGWECHALEGLRQTISSNIPRWAIIECAPWALEGAGKSSVDLHKLIESLGWHVTNPGQEDLVCIRDSKVPSVPS